MRNTEPNNKRTKQDENPAACPAQPESSRPEEMPLGQNLLPQSSRIELAPVKLNLGDIRRFAKLKGLPNDRPVLFNFGQEKEFSAYNRLFLCREVRSRGKIPGTDCLMPPVRFMSAEEFSAMKLQQSRHSINPAAAAAFAARCEAQYVESVGVVEVEVQGIRSRKLPPSLGMSAAEAKLLLADIYHELMHAAGKGEFLAYRGQIQALKAMGIRTSWDDLDIMRFIEKEYRDDPSAIRKAQDEFCRHAAIQAQRQYWREAEAREERDSDREIMEAVEDLFPDASRPEED